MLEQPGDYTQSEWIGMEAMMIRVVWWEERELWAEGLQLVSGSYSDVHAGCSKQTIYAT